MFKPCKNPKIEELTKSCDDRRINLSDLDPILVDGKKHCCWCSEPLKGRQYKWCSQECSDAAFAWANPQKEQGLNLLLVRQNWKCNLCEYTWETLAHHIHFSMYRGYPTVPVFGSKIDWLLIKRLKRRCPPERKPEVDHIVPIYKGGQSLGLDNHQAICYSCHKTKTKSDLSGKRKK